MLLSAYIINTIAHGMNISFSSVKVISDSTVIICYIELQIKLLPSLLIIHHPKQRHVITFRSGVVGWYSLGKEMLRSHTSQV